MPLESTYLFVYGSLREGFQHEAYRYISEHFDMVGNARVRGVLYNVGEYPAAVPASDDRWVTGELYKAHSAGSFEWAMGQLDDYEGLVVEKNETPLYTRQLEEVIFEQQAIKAWVYWYNQPYAHLPVIASGDYLQFIRQQQ